jgi:glucose/arabinose dehydrogenase
MILKKIALIVSLWVLSFTNPLFSSAADVTNKLTRSESLSGWQLLFDGQSMDAWKSYRQEGLSKGWKVIDGAIVRDEKGAGDIVTKKKYKYFELSMEYNISEGGNSGLMFHVTEDNPAPWQSGPEIQIQDNKAGHDPQKSGWLYQLFQPAPPKWTASQESSVLDATRPAGQWNQLFLRIHPKQCEVSMNGQQYFTFKLGDKKWDELVAKSKFAAFPGFGKAGEGHICLQDHNNLVSFRNIKVRELSNEGESAQPIDGKLAMKGTLAFPKLKWQGWQPFDEDGNINKPMRILELTFAPADKRLFAIDQQGWVFVFENRPDVENAQLFLDIQSKVHPWFDKGANEEGLLGLALHPNFLSNGEFYVSYNQRDTHRSIISRFRVSKDNPNQADPGSEEVLLDVEQPFQNHNGGSIEFGGDGYLYVAFGDGGLRNDPMANGQNRGQLLGSILRIDVNSKTDGLPYGIPGDNPFIKVAGVRPEIYAYGFRNPWRIAFDKPTGRLWCGDVGQELWEEVNVVAKGGNYGWSNHEGSHSFGNRPPVDGVGPAIDPVWEYDHSVGKSITGGRVYRSQRLPQLHGKYIYADYIRGSVWALTYEEASGKATRNEQLIADGIPVLAFGEDQNGEVYYSIITPRGEGIFKFDVTSE